MSKFITGTQSQCAAFKAAIDQDAGLPARGVTYGGEDRASLTVPGPGWSITATLPVVTVDAATAVLEVPDEHLPRLGKQVGATRLPALAAALDKTALAPALRTLVYAREGKDSKGDPLPSPLLSQAQPSPIVDVPVEAPKGFVARLVAKPAIVEKPVAPPPAIAPDPVTLAIPPAPEPIAEEPATVDVPAMSRRALFAGAIGAAATLAAATSVMFAVTSMSPEESIDAGLDAAVLDAGAD